MRCSEFITNDGIKNLLNLEILNCYHSEVSNIGLKNLKKLKILHCSRKITNVGIIHLTNMEELYANENINF